MKPEFLDKFGQNVPRYTSYPTAVQFDDSITTEIYSSWLGTLDNSKPISLYIHVPYCHSLCWYCACHTNITSKKAPLSRYVELLKKEFGLVSTNLGGRPKVTHIHWGGGSPNILSAEDFQGLMGVIKQHFQVQNDAENAMEIDPRILTRENLLGFIKAGINRVSLGVQDFNPHVQKAINRIQPFSLTRDIVGWLREGGIRGVNFDLMYGLPEQTLEDVLHNVDLAATLHPDRLSVFGYAHVPWMKPHQKLIDEYGLSSTQERFAMSEGIANRLLRYGYVQIGLDHFAKPDDPLTYALEKGKLRRNFQGYTTDMATTMIGCGASAIGHFQNGFVQNRSSVKDYARHILAGQLATSRGVAITKADQIRWAVIEKLMCEMKVDLKKVCKDFCVPFETFAPEINALFTFETDGLVQRRGKTLQITDKGRPFIRSVCAVFDQYLKSGNARHSRVV